MSYKFHDHLHDEKHDSAGDQLDYAAAGVHLTHAEEAERRYGRVLAAFAQRLGPVGSFGSRVPLGTGWRDPVLVAGTDGVGTKLRIAIATGRHAGVGQDLVAMCANDVACSGAKPLYMQDYLAMGQLEPAVAEAIVSSIAQACRAIDCALIGGETAELPDLLAKGDYDLAGTCIGIAERDALIDGSRVAPGDQVIGFASSGLHSNGFALARRALLDVLRLPLDGPATDPHYPDLAAELLSPTRLYPPLVAALRAVVDVRALAHITGGGLMRNVPRALPAGCAAVLSRSTWQEPLILQTIRSAGVSRAACDQAFNLGLGLIAVVPAHAARVAVQTAQDTGFVAAIVGEIVAGERSCTIVA